jgi:hypothetical protein
MKPATAPVRPSAVARSRGRLAAAVLCLGLAAGALAGCSAPVAGSSAPRSVALSAGASPTTSATRSPSPSPTWSGPPFHYDASPYPATHHLVRRTVSRAVDTMQDLIQSYPDSSRRFGGSWIADDGRSLSVAVTAKYWAGTAPHMLAVMHRTHPDAPFYVVKVRYSEADLDALQHALFTLVYGKATNEAIRDNPTLVIVGTVVQQNRLNAQLLPGHDDVAYKIRARFGTLVIITEDGSIPQFD